MGRQPKRRQTAFLIGEYWKKRTTALNVPNLLKTRHILIQIAEDYILSLQGNSKPPESNMWSCWSWTGSAPLSPPPNTYNRSPIAAEDVWYVLGDGGVPVTSRLSHVPLSSEEMIKVHKWSDSYQRTNADVEAIWKTQPPWRLHLENWAVINKSTFPLLPSCPITWALTRTNMWQDLFDGSTDCWDSLPWGMDDIFNCGF